MLLDDNPFYLLGASTRDDRHRIVELAEEKSLNADQALCSRWSADLLNPRQRLQCEVAWLPGVSSSRASTTATAASKGIALDPLPSPLAQANALATVLAHQAHWGDSELGARTLEIAELGERINAEHVRILLNEDRVAAGIVLLEDGNDVDRAVHGQLDTLRADLTKVFRSAPETVWVRALTEALDHGTKSGTEPGPMLLHALVDALAIDLGVGLDRERTTVQTMIETVSAAAESGQATALQKAITGLGAALRYWDVHAQPLQLSAKSRGQEHEASTEMAKLIRELAVELHNDHEQTEAAQQLMGVVREVFLEVPLVEERASEDLQKLDEFLEQKKMVDERTAIVENIQPVTSAPALYTFNGIGTRVYGRRDEHTATGTYVTTLYFVVFFIPVVPLRCYRVRDGENGGWHFLGRVPLSQGQRFCAWALAAAVALWIVTAAGEETSQNTYASQAFSPAPAYQTPDPPSSQVQGLFSGLTTTAAPDEPPQHTHTPDADPSHYGAGNAFARDRLGRWIDGERLRIRHLEPSLSEQTERLQRLKDKLDRQKLIVEGYKSQTVGGSLPEDIYDEYQADLQRYNTTVDEFNAALGAYKADRAQYEGALRATNDSIERYNRMP